MAVISFIILSSWNSTMLGSNKKWTPMWNAATTTVHFITDVLEGSASDWGHRSLSVFLVCLQRLLIRVF